MYQSLISQPRPVANLIPKLVAWCHCAAAFCAVSLSAAEYDLSRDFSPTANPTGAWSYGAEATFNGPLLIFAVRGLTGSDLGVPIQYWQLVPGLEPTIYRNGTTLTTTLGNGQATLPPGTVLLYSGSELTPNQYGVARFTVPIGRAGFYRISTRVAPVYNTATQGDTDFHVVRNGVELFGQFLAGTQTAGYTNGLNLATGDTIDFVIGRGADRSGTGSGLKLQASLDFNFAPSVQDRTVNVDEDSSIRITLVGTDPDDDMLSYQVSSVAHGTLTVDGRDLIYKPVDNYHGPDAFTYVASDGHATSAVATVTINVGPVNDPPVARATVAPLLELFPDQTSQLVFGDAGVGALVILDGLLSSDVDGDVLQFSWMDAVEGTVIAQGPTFTNTFSIGHHSITLVVSDGQESASETVEFEVISAGQAVAELVPLVEMAIRKWKIATPLLANLEAAGAAFDREHLKVGVIQLRVFQSKVRAGIGPFDPISAESLIEAADKIIDAVRSL